WLTSPRNPNGRGNTEIVKPLASGRDLACRPIDAWIIDFQDLSESDAALYQAPFEHLVEAVRAPRLQNRELRTAGNWWKFRRSGAALRELIGPLSRYVATPLVSRHRIFRWFATP